MITFIMFIGLIIPSFAQSNSTALEGWQFDDDSRSSWDILWTCLSTILACTWTALHVSTPKRDESDNAYTFWKIVGWIFAILAPELMAGVAAEELCRARAVVARCNDALCKLSNESTRLISPPLNTPEIEEQGCDREATSPEKAASTQETEASIRDKPQAIPRWSTVQGYCLTMNGVLLQTKDGWTYPVQPNNVVQLIEAGIVKHFHLRSRDIEDRAKADSLAKAFTLLQSLWVTCNIIARRAYDLPISPLEYSTVAYVACAAVTYMTWWHKPKDMVTPILIFLPYVKDGTDMPLQIRKTLDEGHGSWVQLPDAVDGDFLRWLKAAAHLLRLPFTVKGRKLLIEGFTKGYADVKQELSNDDSSPVNDRPQDEEIAQPSKLEESQRSTSKVRNPPELLSVGSYINLANLYMFVALLFCGIHVAAWNSEFPTKAEQICWRVFSLSAFCVVWPIYLVHIWRFWRLYRAAGDKRALIGALDISPGRILIIWAIWFWVYSIARWGNLILMFTSLRALPAESYLTIDWMSTIPHI